MKRGQPLQRRTPLRSTSSLRASRLNPVSRKRAKENRVYSKLRVVFLAEHPRCVFPGGCTQPSTDVHHRKGRVGALLLDVAHWSALCRPHHAWTTEHPAAAVEMGISELRIGSAA